MKKMLGILFLFFVNLFANTFTIASYNVENLFDLEYNKTEYKEYIPNNKHNWNKKTYNTKLQNTVKVIKELNPTIIALQEIESKKVLKNLQENLPLYKYKSFIKYKNSSVGVAVLSKIKILDTKNINVYFSNKRYRPIQEVTLKYKNYKFKLFNNHWPSKKVSENYRIKYAYTLFSRIKELPTDYDYILIGDFNSNYNEFESFANNKKLNTTNYITGINQVLNTTLNKKYIQKELILNYKRKVHYNLWLDLPYKNRFSYKYRGNNQTPDNIILSPALFDLKKISYVNNSFKVFKPKYLYSKKKIHRWKIKNKIHLNSGFSDHLPIIASFSLKQIVKNKQKQISKISQLYTIENLQNNAFLEKCVVIYKNENMAIIKQKKNRAIYIYKKNHTLEVGKMYNLEIIEIKRYNGLKEITDFKIKKDMGKVFNLESFYIKNSAFDFNDLKFQNEVIINIKGIYIKGYFLYKGKKIKLYFKQKELKPKNNSKLLIKKAQVGFYKSKPQLIIHKQEDFEKIF